MDKKFYIGVDLGGSFIKAGIVDEAGNIIADEKTETQPELGNLAVIDKICLIVNKLVGDNKIEKQNIVGVGLGVPGLVDSERGVAILSHNLKFNNFLIAKKLQTKLNLKVKVSNDANVATLAETLYGAGKGYKNVVMLTLGTGVGGGAVVEGKLMQGFNGYGAEFGHTVIEYEGRQCSCGRKGCLEVYCSATALIKQTKQAMLNNKESEMWKIGDINLVDGKTAFIYQNKDKVAKQVVEEYINYLVCGITNIANVFRPNIIVLGGGISNQKEGLYDALNERLEKQIFGNGIVQSIKVVPALLRNKAGILGAAALFFE